MGIQALDILFADEHIVAVHKPEGLLVHRSLIDRRETRFALQLVRDQLGRLVYPVHRLDKPTSGVLLLALSAEAARSLVRSFTDGDVEKTYMAVLRGVTEEEGVIDHPLLEEPDRMTDGKALSGKDPQEAVTAYRRLAAAELPVAVGRYPTSRYSLVEAKPLTGRRHQLRRHFKHLFHPIIGDTKFGEGRHNRFFRQEFDCCRLLLAAVELSFPHPVSRERVTVRAPIKGDFAALVGKLGWWEAVPGRWRT
jgi:tRNA pseudouridine65 synthase